MANASKHMNPKNNMIYRNAGFAFIIGIAIGVATGNLAVGVGVGAGIALLSVYHAKQTHR